MHRGAIASGAKKIAGVLLWAAVSVLIAGAPANAGPGRTVAFVNSTRLAMVALRIRQSGTNDWQPNLLDHRTLGVQKQTTIELPEGSSCFFDIVCVFEDGHRQMKPHVNLCTSPMFSVTSF